MNPRGNELQYSIFCIAVYSQGKKYIYRSIVYLWISLHFIKLTEKQNKYWPSIGHRMRFLKAGFIHGKTHLVRYKGRKKISTGLFFNLFLRNYSNLWITGVLIKEKPISWIYQGPGTGFHIHMQRMRGTCKTLQALCPNQSARGNILNLDQVQNIISQNILSNIPFYRTVVCGKRKKKF